MRLKIRPIMAVNIIMSASISPGVITLSTASKTRKTVIEMRIMILMSEPMTSER